ncbi:cholecystokinin receptor type A-like [Macrosteles quadrilineatus]|uniref:cholecystokinin receptor type A-like n=1 Tax=Macrosteles quadrilineatus TaxID=74068 RepID=UPI0023E141AA|nr:cholecystokinin receptor type A-like [Macrosteles quadrilineatus]
MTEEAATHAYILVNTDLVNITLYWVNESSSAAPTVARRAATGSTGISDAIVPMYVVIFLLAVVGNALVVVTLVRNKRMRTVTNVYLLNLAVSDLLLGVFCMPFTLVGQVLRNFIFGSTMCKLIPYFQAVSVSVGVWTLVAISLERYFAICRPLKSRRWQTQFHAYKMIAVVWMSSLAWNMPILLVSRLQAMRAGRHKCREDWPSPASERVFNIFLDMILLLIPLVIMTLAYSLIVSKLWKGLQREIKHNSSCRRRLERTSSSATMNDAVVINNNTTGLRQHRLLPPPLPRSAAQFQVTSTDAYAATLNLWLFKLRVPKALQRSPRSPVAVPLVTSTVTTPVVEPTPTSTGDDDETTYTFSRHAIRSNYMDKSIEAKKKVIRMLFVVVAEFFVCWAPLHVLNTWYLFYPETVYKYVGSTGVSLVQLLAYISSCCNPITYCFMNRKFRQAFLAIFNWYKWRGCCGVKAPVDANGCPLDRLGEGCGTVGPNNSELSGNDSTIYMGRGCRSEVVVLETEERV